jgi:hypothetical protein
VKTSSLSRILFILAALVVVVGAILAVSTSGSQLAPSLVVAAVLVAAGLIFNGKRRG